MVKNNIYFPFEQYINSTNLQEYSKDVRRKNYIIKYVNILTIDELDYVSLNKLVQNLFFFRNTFTKDSFLHFFNNMFSNEEKSMLALVIYEMFVLGDIGIEGEQKTFANESWKLYEFVDYRRPLNVNWVKIKEQK